MRGISQGRGWGFEVLEQPNPAKSLMNLQDAESSPWRVYRSKRPYVHPICVFRLLVVRIKADRNRKNVWLEHLAHENVWFNTENMKMFKHLLVSIAYRSWSISDYTNLDRFGFAFLPSCQNVGVVKFAVSRILNKQTCGKLTKREGHLWILSQRNGFWGFFQVLEISTNSKRDECQVF